MSKAKTLKRGDAWTTKDRLWAIVTSGGCLVREGSGAVQIYSNRARALSNRCENLGERIVRLSDLSGIVQ